MHCIACDKNLNDLESTRKSEITGEYLDLCNHCYATISDTFIEDPEENQDENSEEYLEGSEYCGCYSE